MPIKQESLNRDLYGLLKSRGYRPDMFTSGGKKVSIPEEAEAFQFEFVKDGKNYGKATVTIDGLHRLIVYYTDEIADSPAGDAQDISWTTLLKHLKRWAKNRALGFQLSDQDDLEADMAKREHNKIEGLNEGYYPMGKKASYSDNVPSTKIILQHTRQLGEGEQRYRNVEKIFVENASGERFLLPTNKPGLARVYARHIAEGGTPYDERGTHITGLVEEYQKMAGFIRATRNNQFNESAQRLISEGINHYEKLRETLHKMAGKRGYTEYFNNYAPPLMEDEGAVDISEMFMQSSLDPRIENVMPILSKLSKNLVEAEIPQVKELEEWADNISESRMADEMMQRVSSAVSDIKAQNPGLDREQFEEQLWDYLDAEYGTSMARMALDNSEMYWNEYNGQGINEMDSEGYTGTRDPVSKSTYGSRDKGLPSHGPEKTGKALTAKQMMDRAHKAMMKSMSDDEKVDKGWRNPNMEEGLEEVDTGQYDAVKSTPKGKQDDDVFKRFREKVRQYGDELGQRQGEKKEKEVDEGLDAQQKQAGQLGPTEKVKNNNIGKLVGASESVDPLLRIKKLLGK